MTPADHATQPARSRSAQIDFMRAVAILSVVLIHTWGGATEVTRERTPEHAAFFAFFVAGSVWAVPMFFFVSGLMLTRSADPETWRGPLDWWRRRLLRLLPPYLFWSVLSLLVAGVGDPLEALLKLATGAASYHMYFVVALLQVYVLWSLTIRWLQRASPRTQYAVLIGAMLVSLAAHCFRAFYLSHVEVDGLPLMRATVLPWVGYFALGCLAALRQGNASPDRPLRVPIVPATPTARRIMAVVCSSTALVALSVSVLLRVTYTGPHADHPLNVAIRPVYSLCLIWLVSLAATAWGRRALGAKAMEALARDAYGIYLSHVLAMHLLTGLVYFSGPPLAFGLDVLYRVMALALALAASWGTTRLLARIPVLRVVSGADAG